MGKILYFGALTILAMTVGAGRSQAPARYPNELPGFRFYESHLKPLEPYASDHDTVARVLGSAEVSQTNGWRMQPFFIGKDNDSTIAPELVGRLADIEITPTRRVSMLGVKFPKTFTQGGGGISEINISFDVYRDRFGLEYWIHAEDSNFGKKGDLMHIVYGPSEKSVEKWRRAPAQRPTTTGL